MLVIVHPAPSGLLPASEIERWWAIPVAVAVDLVRAAGQIDLGIRPIRPAGQQPRLFGRAVTAWSEPPDVGAVPMAIDRIGAGDALVIAANGHSETAMIGKIQCGHLRSRKAFGLICDGAFRDEVTLNAPSEPGPERRGDMP